MTDGSIRASDNDRETIVAALREAFTEGRLTLDEFEERTSAAYASRTWGALRELTSDLPSPPVLSTEQGAGQGSGQAEVLDVPAQVPPMAPVPPMAQVGPDAMRAMPRRQRPFGRLLPVVFIWAIIAAGAGASHLAVVLAVVFVVVLGIRALSGSRW
jgi:Domain of unknown function (DUF1707)